MAATGPGTQHATINSTSSVKTGSGELMGFYVKGSLDASFTLNDGIGGRLLAGGVIGAGQAIQPVMFPPQKEPKFVDSLHCTISGAVQVQVWYE